jgi:hypothetical protein
MNPEIFVKTLLDELKAIAAGTSKLTNGAILFDPKKLPFCAVLDRFNLSPTKELAKEVAKVADQDFGMRFGNWVAVQVEKLNTEFFKEQPAPPAPPAPEIPFQQALFSELTTILGRGRERAIDQKLLDTMTQDVTRLAILLDGEIKKQAHAQAKEVCAIAVKLLGEELDKVAALAGSALAKAESANFLLHPIGPGAIHPDAQGMIDQAMKPFTGDKTVGE